MTYLYLKSQSDDNIREEVTISCFILSSISTRSFCTVTRSNLEYPKYLLRDDQTKYMDDQRYEESSFSQGKSIDVSICCSKRSSFPLQAQQMSEFIAYPLEALNETYLNSSHANVIHSALYLACTREDFASLQLHITVDSHLANVISLLGHEVRKNIALFRRPVDKKQYDPHFSRSIAIEILRSLSDG